MAVKFCLLRSCVVLAASFAKFSYFRIIFDNQRPVASSIMPPKRKTVATKEKPVDDVPAEPKKARGAKKLEESVPEVIGANGDAKPKRGRLMKTSSTDVLEEEREETPPAEAKEKKGRGRKAAKAPAEPKDESEPKEKKTRGRKPSKDDVIDLDEEDEVTPPPEIKEKKGRGRKAAAPKVVEDEKSNSEEERETPPPVIKEKKGRGRKAAAPPPKVVEDEEEDDEEERDETPPPEIKEKKGRGRKAAAPKVEEDEEVDDEEEHDETPPPEIKEKKGRGRKAAAPKVEEDEDEDELETLEKPKPKGRAKKESASTSKGEALMNPTETFYDDIDFSCNKENSLGQTPNLVIASWNVDGLRAWFKKDGLKYVELEKPDIFCIQESKCSDEKLPPEVSNLEGYHKYWKNSDKEGYAGVGLFSRIEPIKVDYGIGEPEHDEDGRCITAEFEKFYVVSVYVPNAGKKLVTLPKRLEWNKAFKSYIQELDEKKPVIICGDMNVAHSEIDLANPKTNTKNAGFTKEEREGMTAFLADGFVDTYRKLYPEKTGAYTFWTYMMKSRSKNVGWRLDYFLVSDKLMDNICDNVIRSEVLGSDHCPIVLFLNV